MNIHLYSFIWNEERILPHFFNHYDNYVTKYFIYDNFSNDDTKYILEKKENCNVLFFNTYNKFDEENIVKLRNSEWKKSAKEADWIIVCDCDEFILFDKNKLENIDKNNYSVIKPFGYDMRHDSFPSYNKPITNQVRKGVRGGGLDKPIMFKPSMINKTNFSLGSHFAMPEGNVKVYNQEDIKLLHYKVLGYDYYSNRTKILYDRIPIENRKRGISTHYKKSDVELKDSYKILMNNLKYII